MRLALPGDEEYERSLDRACFLLTLLGVFLVALAVLS
jgi:hypothetical protein